MIRYIFFRLTSVPLNMLAVSILTFAFLHLVPGDAADALGGETMSEEDKALLRQQFGLDRPVIVQFFYWLWNAVQGNLGISMRTSRPVIDEVMSRLAVSVELALYAVIIALIIGILAGAIAIRWRNTWVDSAIMGFSTVGMSTPNFFFATVVVLAISLYFPEIGVVSYVPLSQDVLGNLGSMFVPALSLALLSGATFCRYVRGAAEDIFRGADFVRTARSKGASERRILFRHVIPNSLIPLTTAAGLQLAYLVGGTVVMESIFALPGIGQLMLASIATRDYPVVQGCVLLQAVTFVVINLAVDLLYPVLDPRIKKPSMS